MFARYFPWFLALLILLAGFWLAFRQPSELAKQLTSGEAYVFYVNKDSKLVVPVRRDVPKDLDVLAAARIVFDDLLLGPTEDETKQGLITKILPANQVRDVSIKKGKLHVSFARDIYFGVLAPADQRLVYDQVKKTALRLPGVKKIDLTLPLQYKAVTN
jgi:hypothetical protein